METWDSNNSFSTDFAGTPMIQDRTLLPMLGHTRGNRNAATCHFKCGNACAKDVCNARQRVLPRHCGSASPQSCWDWGRWLLPRCHRQGNLQAPAAAAQVPAARDREKRTSCPFRALHPSRAPATRSAFRKATDGTPSSGGEIRCSRTPRTSTSTSRAPRTRQAQFGYNNDYLNVIVDKYSGRTGVLVANHEYTNEDLMFDPEWFAANKPEAMRIAMAAHGILRGGGQARTCRTSGGNTSVEGTQPTDHRHPRCLPLTVRLPAPTLLKTVCRPVRAQDPWHLEQLLGRHHPVGHRGFR